MIAHIIEGKRFNETKYALPATGGLPSVLLRGGAMTAVAPQKRQCEI